MSTHHNSRDRDADVSKSQLKRDAHALADLGRSLAELSAAELAAVPLSETVRAAVVELRRMSAHVARKRQLQYLAKLLRQVDTQTIVEAIDSTRAAHTLHSAQLHRLEAWRTALIDQGDRALNALMATCPHADRQQLRSLTRKARRELEENRSPSAARQLFRTLRSLDGVSHIEPPPVDKA